MQAEMRESVRGWTRHLISPEKGKQQLLAINDRNYFGRITSDAEAFNNVLSSDEHLLLLFSI